MKVTKKVDLGEYIIIIDYDDVTGSLDVTVLDELEGVIEAINVTNDEDPDNEEPEIDPSLN
jgi:hypothetical protein